MLSDPLARLIEAYGPQYWWPAESDFEIVAGAILVQNTAWNNASRALQSLKQAAALSPQRVLSMPLAELAVNIRSSGTFNVKATRLKALASWWQQIFARGGSMSTTQLRRSLLDVPGIGHETADCILLYIFARPQLVIDTYLRRVAARVVRIDSSLPYDQLQSMLANNLPGDSQWLGEAHAVVVAHCQRFCMRTPQCEACVIRDICAESGSTGGSIQRD